MLVFLYCEIKSFSFSLCFHILISVPPVSVCFLNLTIRNMYASIILNN